MIRHVLHSFFLIVVSMPAFVGVSAEVRAATSSNTNSARIATAVEDEQAGAQKPAVANERDQKNTNDQKNTKNASLDPSKNAQWYAHQVESLARNDPAGALRIAAEGITYFALHPSPVEHAIVLNESSYALYFQARYPEALARAKEAEAFAKLHLDAKALARARLLQGNVLQTIGEFEQALVFYQQAATFYKDTQDREWLLRVLYNMGNVYLSAGRAQEAFEYYQRVGAIASSDMENAEVMLGLGNALTNMDKLNDSVAYYQNALTLFEKVGDAIGVQLSYSGLAYVKRTQGEFDSALALYDSALRVMREGERQYNEVPMLLNRAITLFELARYQESLAEVQNAMKVAERQKDDRELLSLQLLLAELQIKMGNVNGAVASLNVAENLLREKSNSEANRRVAVMKVAFDTELRAQELELLKAKSELQALEIRQQNALWIIVVAGLLIAGGSLFFWVNHRANKRVLAEQRAISEKLRELDKTKDQVLANTSHELRTPLNGIIGMTQLILSSEHPLNEDIREQIGVVEECGQRLLHLIQDILDYSQLQLGRLRIEVSAQELKPVLLSAHNLLKPLADEKGLAILLYLPSNIPKVMMDPHRIEQAILNLLGNAIKFSRRGVITLSAGFVDEYQIEVSVKDEGPGIAPEKMEKIFQPFEQVDGSFTRQTGGSGLGLAITRELLRLHGSELKLTSTYGQGAEFSFRLPIALERINL